MHYQSILLPVDGTAESEPAAEHGLALAERYGADVVAVSVVDLGYTEGEFPDATAWATLHEGARADAEATLEEFSTDAERRHPGVAVRRQVLTGNPARVLLDELDRGSYDLVVMGPHRASRFRRLFVGSTTERVVRSSTVPVLTLRARLDVTSTDYRTVVVATDGSPGSARAVREAVALAAEYGATLHAVFALESQYARSYSIREFMEREGARALRRVVEAAATAGVDVRDRMLEGPPADAIVGYADRHDADLVVVGTHGRTGLDRLVVGSVAAHVVRTASVPVLTVRTVDDHRLPD